VVRTCGGLAEIRRQDLVNTGGSDRGMAGADRDLVKVRDHVAAGEESRDTCALMLIDFKTTGIGDSEQC
jgi:hypothetical protein